VTDELHFGEASFAHTRPASLRELANAIYELHRLVREQNHLLHLILEREPLPTFPQPTGVAITVTG
jgi:hypothetical protein